MTHYSTISVRKRMGASPNYRNSATELFNGARPGARVLVMDFEGVEFISRGFADQFHKDRLSFQERTGVQVEIENASPDVQHMLQVVSRTQDVVRQARLSIPVIQVMNVDELRGLLCE